MIIAGITEPNVQMAVLTKDGQKELPTRLKVARRVGELVAQGMSVEEALSLIPEEQEA
jgi:uncharacterized protein YoaH (UPF0181 family)